jgi:hypothetical protein
MGILDDAIREHLELKRRHGVPEDEVERQEEEALGPTRRDVAQQPEDEEIAADAVDDASHFDGEQRDAPVADAPVAADDETVIAEPSAVEHPPALEEPPGEREPAEAPAAGAPPEPLGAEAPAEPVAPGPPSVEAAPEPDPYEELGDTEPHGFPALEDDDLHEDDDQEDGDRHEDDDHEDDDHENDRPDALPPEADGEDDVLEDTPDFLQETPEHDRLWFEQKPPRDFDFD